MKVSTIGDLFKEQKSYKVKRGNDGDFSSNLNMAQKEYTEKELKEKLQKINELGIEIKDKPNLAKIKQYKQYVKEYLSFVLKHYYKLSQSYGLNSTRILTRVEVINKKIEELSDDFMKQQMESLNIISRIDEISGLLIDLYM